MENTSRIRAPFLMSDAANDLARRSWTGSEWRAKTADADLFLTEQDARAVRLYALTRHPAVDHLISSVNDQDLLAVTVPTLNKWEDEIEPGVAPSLNTGKGYQAPLVILHALRKAAGRERAEMVLGQDITCIPVREVIDLLNRDRICLDQLDWQVVQ